MSKNFLLITALLFAQLFFACRSARPAGKNSSVLKQAEQTINYCEQTIKYSCSKAKDERTQTEVDLSAEIIFNPSEKLITMVIGSPEKSKIEPKASMERMDCTLNPSLTGGYAAYRALAFEKDNNLENREVSFRIEAKDGDLAIVMTDERKKSPFIIRVDSWEVIR